MLKNRECQFDSQHRQVIYLFCKASKPAVGPTQAPTDVYRSNGPLTSCPVTCKHSRPKRTKLSRRCMYGHLERKVLLSSASTLEFKSRATKVLIGTGVLLPQGYSLWGKSLNSNFYSRRCGYRQPFITILHLFTLSHVSYKREFRCGHQIYRATYGRQRGQQMACPPKALSGSMLI